MRPATPRRALAAVLVVALAVSTFAGVAAADERAGGTIVVEEGETVTDDLRATGGTVVVRGTVEGALEAFAGSVEIAESGTVTGDLSGATGSIRVAGIVEGDLDAAAGSIDVPESGTIGGDVQAGAGSFTLAGTVDGTVRVGAGSVSLTPTAAIGGDFVYDGEFTQAEGATVDGEVRHDPSLGSAQVDVLPGIASWLLSLYFLALTLLVGALLLVALPGVSATVADVTANSPLHALGAGLLTLLGAPIVLSLLVLTIVGIPISLVGFFLYVILLLLGFVWGAYAVGAWLLSLADRANRWLALVLGVLVVHAVGYIPVVGGFVEFAVLLFGVGGVTIAVYRHFQRRRRSDERPAPAA